MTRSRESGIYAIINLLDGKRYIGSAVNLKRRRWDHFSDLRNGVHKNGHLQNAFNKYGEDAFCYSVLELVFDKSNLIEREQVWIDGYEFDELYNIARIAGSSLGTKHSEETRKKISASRMGNRWSVGNKNALGRICSEETKKKISLANSNPSDETRAKMSMSRKGLVTISDEHRAKISAARTGSVASPETREKMSLSHKNPSPETRKKISDASKGRTASPETREKMSKSAKELWEKRRNEKCL